MSLTARIAAGLVWCALTACAPAGPGERGPDAGGTGASGTDPAPAHVVAAAPGTYALPLAADTRRCLLERLERGDLRIARLTLSGLRPRNAQALKGVRVFVERPVERFVERPEAGTGTPTDDPHAAGAFVLGLEAEQTFVLNIAPTLDALWRSGVLDAGILSSRDGLRLTFVADPWEEAGALPQDFALPIARIRLEVPCE